MLFLDKIVFCIFLKKNFGIILFFTMCRDSIRNDPNIMLVSYIKRAQTISFVERGFERLGLGHRTEVSRLVRTELGRVRSRSLSP